MIASPQIGRVFTPLFWARWLIDRAGIFAGWVDGANVLDPTCGRGAFLEAFISLARDRGISVRNGGLTRLHGIEICSADKFHFISHIKEHYGIEFPEANYVVADFVTYTEPKMFDFIVGNPPWLNYTELPAVLKEKWKNAFIHHGLVRDKRDVLLGGSRADLATLVVKKALDHNLRDHGLGVFYIPFSIFFNSGANDLFRPYTGSGHTYSVSKLWDFGSEDIFNGIATRYGAALFDKGEKQTWPVETWVRSADDWQICFSTSSDERGGHWVRHNSPSMRVHKQPVIMASPTQRPRQGVNTCGANDIFIFHKDGEYFLNGSGERTKLDEVLVFPLVHAGIFGSKGARQKWILIPHDTKTGKPLDHRALSEYPATLSYLDKHRDRLCARKGTLINAHIKRGLWWALMGVGSYSFAPWKVIWEAFGRKEFRPRIVEGQWQGNQALHAFCPCESLAQAQSLCEALRSETVKTWLKSSGMEGTCNWAQPGRISKLLTLAHS
jgi:hypothetical protein